ncbi:MAG: hypothetical protein PVI88_04275 [Nitrosopumilaceae archaeon]|jgi:hypothetical protein
MNENANNMPEYDRFITEFPMKGYGIVEHLQGRVHFALLDQMKLMHTSGMTHGQIKEQIVSQVNEIIENFDPEKEPKTSSKP